MSGPMRFGLIGVGKMGRHHARVINEIDSASLVVVCDQNKVNAKKVSEKYGVSFCTNIIDMLRYKLDAVVIATPTVTHESIAEILLKKQIHCLIEKPLALDTNSSINISQCALESGAFLQVGHVVRYDPVIRAIKNLNLVPCFIEISRVSPFTFRSVDVGVVLDMMIHDIDLLTMFLGVEPEEIYANSINVFSDKEDICNARLIFPLANTVYAPVANITASRLAMKTERKIRIFSEDMYVSADFILGKGIVIKRKANDKKLDDICSGLINGDNLSDYNYQDLVITQELNIESGDPLTLQLIDFIESINHGRNPSVDVNAGMSAVKTAERIIQIAEGNRKSCLGKIN